MKVRIFALFSLLLFFMLAGVTSACGGFFCTNVPIDQNAERIIFTVNGDGTMTAIVGIGYEGNAEDFSWVVPVPSPPELDVADTTSLDNLQQLSTPNFIEPDLFPCHIFADFPGMGGGGGLFIEKGNVGPYDYVIIGGRDVEELVTWLRDNSYRVEPEMEPIIAQYVEEGMLFLAMKLSQESEVGDIQPIVMTYKSEQPMIPLRLTAIAATDNMPVLVWIFGESQYLPVNYTHAEVDYSQLEGVHQVRGMSVDIQPFDWFFWSGRSEYQVLLDEIQNEYDGQAFVTEMALPTATLLDEEYRLSNLVPSFIIQGDPLLTDLMTNFSYVTRLRAQLSPEQMTVDPVFAPAPQEDDVIPVIEMNDYVDPLDFYGCSSRTVISDETRDLLPDGALRLDEQGLVLRYPADWVMSEFTLPVRYQSEEEGSEVIAFSPEPVTEETFLAFFEGEATPPMFYIFPDLRVYSWSRNGGMDMLYREVLAWDDERIPSDDISAMNLPVFARVRLNPFTERFGAALNPQGAHFGILADDETWAEQGEMFTAMLDYAGSFDYYLDDALQHTLFLAPDNYDLVHARMYVPYPNNWTERMNGSTVEILSDSGIPVVRLTPLSDFLDCDLDECERTVMGLNNPAYTDDAPFWGRAEAWIQENYAEDFSLSDDEIALLLECEPEIAAPTAFSNDERQGTVQVLPRYVLELSAPHEHYEAYLPMMERIREHMAFSTAECSIG